MPEIKKRYNSLQEYQKILRQFPLTNTVKIGRFYSLAYDFLLHYEYDELKFYDHFPLFFVFSVQPDKNLITAINFHHLPVRPRLLWLDRVKKLSKHLDETVTLKGLGGRPVYKIGGLKYPKVYKVLPKSKIGIRNYRMDKMFFIRNIDLRFIDEILHYYAKTWLGVNIGQIKSRYSKYIP